MSQQDLLTELANRGLRAWQATFVASFLNADPSPFQMLAAPPGTGKTFAAIAIIRELVDRGAKRILILVPAYLCEAWRMRIGEAQSDLPVTVITRLGYREIEASVPVGQSPWGGAGIFVISQDLAKQPDIAASLSTVVWALVVLDEAHRFAARKRSALLDQLVSAGVVQHLLLLTATPIPALQHWLHPSPDQPTPLSSPPAVTSWYGELRNWDHSIEKLPRVEWQVVRYMRGADEVRFISQLIEEEATLRANLGNNQLLTQMLVRRAASSTFAAEQTLRRLRLTLRSRLMDLGLEEGDSEEEANIDNSHTEAKTDGSAAADSEAAIKIIEKCLETLDSVTTDQKLAALKRQVLSIAFPAGHSLRICVFSTFVDTVSYVSTALAEISNQVLKITGRDSFADRAATVEQFRNAGGLLVGTDAGTEGIDLLSVNHVIHYDLPLNAMALHQRLGRFNRYGRTIPCTMYVFRDESGAITFESEIIDRLTSAARTDNPAGIDGSATQ